MATISILLIPLFIIGLADGTEFHRSNLHIDVTILSYMVDIPLLSFSAWSICLGLRIASTSKSNRVTTDMLRDVLKWHRKSIKLC